MTLRITPNPGALTPAQLQQLIANGKRLTPVSGVPSWVAARTGTGVGPAFSVSPTVLGALGAGTLAILTDGGSVAAEAIGGAATAGDAAATAASDATTGGAAADNVAPANTEPVGTKATPETQPTSDTTTNDTTGASNAAKAAAAAVTGGGVAGILGKIVKDAKYVGIWVGLIVLAIILVVSGLKMGGVKRPSLPSIIPVPE